MDAHGKIELLEELLHVAKDGEATFDRALEITEDRELRSAFRTALRSCVLATRQLTERIRALGRMPDERGTLGGAFHRVWIDTRAALSPDEDRALLDEIVRAEQTAVERYDAAREAARGSDLFDLVDSQASGAKANLERFRSLRERYAEVS